MKELIDALESRVKSPLLGYFFLALFVINWRPIFYLIFENAPILERIKYFDSNSSSVSLLVWPLVFTAIVTVAYPWVRYSLVFLSIKPTELINLLQAQIEHKLLLKKKELEELRSKILSHAERELIERAKRDGELDEIEDEQIRDKLKSELDQLRKYRDSKEDGSRLSSAQSKFNELMGMAETYRERARGDKVDVLDRNELIRRAQQLEKKAHELIIAEADA